MELSDSLWSRQDGDNHLESEGNYDIEALKIQLLWRSFCNKRIYRYFRTIIVEKLRGAPREILKTIVPDEAVTLDRSTGAHVRFRLGGPVFPPKILFKIYTHQPLCDIGAFAPRNYSLEKSPDMLNKLKVASKMNTKIVPINLKVGARYFDVNVTTTVDIDNWYKREENNPWRPIISNKLDELLTPPWLKNNFRDKAPQKFHYSKLKRKDDMLMKRRQRKREWMMKAYMFAANIEEIENAGVASSEIERIQKKSVDIINDVRYNITNGKNSYYNPIDKSEVGYIVPEIWKGEDLFFKNPTTDDDFIKWR